MMHTPKKFKMDPDEPNQQTFHGEVRPHQLAIKFKRCHEHVATIFELITKVSTGLERLEDECSSQREEIELIRCGLKKSHKTNTIPTSPKKRPKPAPSAARMALEMMDHIVSQLQSKMEQFEEIVLSDKRAIEQALGKANQELQRHRETKDILNEVEKKLIIHTEQTNTIKNRIELMEHHLIAEASARIEAERRAYSAESEVAELKHELNVINNTVAPAKNTMAAAPIDTGSRSSRWFPAFSPLFEHISSGFRVLGNAIGEGVCKVPTMLMDMLADNYYKTVHSFVVKTQVLFKRTAPDLCQTRQISMA